MLLSLTASLCLLKGNRCLPPALRSEVKVKGILEEFCNRQLWLWKLWLDPSSASGPLREPGKHFPSATAKLGAGLPPALPHDPLELRGT